MWHKVNFKWVLTGLKSAFSFPLTSYHTKIKEPSLSYYLPIAGWRIVGFMPFPRVLILYEMKSTSPGFEIVSQFSFSTTMTLTPPNDRVRWWVGWLTLIRLHGPYSLPTTINIACVLYLTQYESIRSLRCRNTNYILTSLYTYLYIIQFYSHTKYTIQIGYFSNQLFSGLSSTF